MMRKFLIAFLMLVVLFASNESFLSVSAIDESTKGSSDIPEENMRMDLDKLDEKEEYVEIEMDMYKDNTPLDESMPSGIGFRMAPASTFKPSLGLIVGPDNGTHDIYDL